MKKVLLLIIANFFSAYCMEKKNPKRIRYNLREMPQRQLRINLKRKRKATKRKKKKKECSLSAYLNNDEFLNSDRLKEEEYDLSGLTLKDLDDFKECTQTLQLYSAQVICRGKELSSNEWTLATSPKSVPLLVKLLDLNNTCITSLPIGLLQNSLPFLEYINAQHTPLKTLDCTDLQHTSLTIDVRDTPISLEEITKALEAGRPTFFQRMAPHIRRNIDSTFLSRFGQVTAESVLLYGSFIIGDLNSGIPYGDINPIVPRLLTGIYFSVMSCYSADESLKHLNSIKTLEHQISHRPVEELKILHDYASNEETADE